MDEFKKLMVYGWELGKQYFNVLPNTPEKYEAFTDLANDMLKTQNPGTKEYDFLHSLLAAVNQYCDADWRERNSKGGTHEARFNKI